MQMLKNLFPYKIIRLDKKFFNPLIVMMIVFFIVGLIFAILISPPDYIQGDSVRIMYVHVPASFISLFTFGFIGIISALSLIFKIKIFPLMAKSLAPLGLIFTITSIVTGSLWGKPTWGVWWAWDARLTSMLILLLFYLIYISTWKLIPEYNKANKISSIVAIIGTFNLPIIKFSVDWWNTLHQPASISKLSSPSIDISMLQPLLVMTLAFSFIAIIIAIIRIKAEILLRKNHL